MGRRTRKSGAVRREELLDVARARFLEHGYDNTSVQQLIDALGLSKGAFYHHFPSKEALLDGLVDAMAREGLEAAAPVLEGPGDALARLNAFFGAANAAKRAQAPLLRAFMTVLYRPENLALRVRLSARTVSLVAPALGHLIAEGVAQGRFEVRHPQDTAEVMLHLGALLNDHLAELLQRPELTPAQAREAVTRRVALFEDLLARSLGIGPGELTLLDPALIAALFPDPSSDLEGAAS